MNTENQILKTKNSTAILKVDPRNIVVKDGFNVRIDMGDLIALSESIVSVGLQVPLKAKKITGQDKYEIIDGHRRYQAIMIAIDHGHDIRYVDVILFSGGEEDRIFSMLVTGTGQKPLNDVEQSEAVSRLVGFGYKVEEVATKMGRSLPYGYYLYNLSQLSKRIKNLIVEGYISGGAVMEIVKITDDEQEQFELVQEAIENAQKGAEEGKIKKATAKNVNKEKRLTPIQKLDALIEELDKDNIQNSKVDLLVELVTMAKDKEAGVSDLMFLFRNDESATVWNLEVESDTEKFLKNELEDDSEENG